MSLYVCRRETSKLYLKVNFEILHTNPYNKQNTQNTQEHTLGQSRFDKYGLNQTHTHSGSSRDTQASRHIHADGRYNIHRHNARTYEHLH